MKRLNQIEWRRLGVAFAAVAIAVLGATAAIAQEKAPAPEESTSETAVEDSATDDPVADDSADDSATEESDEPTVDEATPEESSSPADSPEEAVDDAHGGDHGEHDLGHGNASASLEDPSALYRDLAVYTFVVFLGLLVLLGRFAWPTIVDALEAREKRIESNIAEAENRLEDAKSIVAEHEAKLAGAAEQVRELLEEARRDADATIAQAKTDAKAEFEAERERATRDIRQARDNAVRELAEKTAGLAIDLAGRVVKQDITSDRQSEIVREALGRFSKNDTNAN